MNSIQNFLKNLGLNDKEALVYLVLLELGPQAASVVAKKSKIPRSSTFFQLENLIQKGFVKKEIRANLQYFCAISPDNLRYLLKRKQQQAENQLEILEALLPQLNDLCSEFLPQPKVSYFQGVEGAYKMIDFVLKNEGPVYFILSDRLHPEIDLYLRKNYALFYQNRRNEAQVIMADSKRIHSYLEDDEELYEWVGLLEGLDIDFESTIMIHANATHFLSGDSDDLTGVLIENTYLAKTMKSIFNLIKKSAIDH